MDSEGKVICVVVLSALTFFGLLFGGIHMSERMDQDTARICIQAGKVWDDGNCKEK